MLGKLLKYELRATSRYFLPMYLILFCMTIINKILMSVDVLNQGYLKLLTGLFMATYVMLNIGIVIATVIIMIYRFYQNLITDEGYLMFTLPVKTHSLILSKWLISSFWTVVSVICIVLSVFLLLLSPSFLSNIDNYWNSFFNLFIQEMGSSSNLLVIEMILLLVVSLFYNSIMIYASIAMGQALSRRKILGAIAAYLIINTVMQLFSGILMLIVMFLFSWRVSDPSVIYVFIFPISIASSIVLGGVFFYITNYVFKRKLNLE